MLIVYVILTIIFFLVNGVIYISAIWLLRKGLKSFPQKAYLLLWPILLVCLNLYFALIVTPQEKTVLKALNDGMVYQTIDKPSHIAIRGYTSVNSSQCYDLCMEMLLEGHLKYVTVISDNLRQGQNHKTRSVTYQAYKGDCLAYPSTVTRISQYHAFYGHCVRPVTIDEVPDIELVLDTDLNNFYKPNLKSKTRRYHNGIAILNTSQSRGKLLAIQAGDRLSIDSVFVPIMLRIFNGDGMEGAPQFDRGLVSRQLRSETRADRQSAIVPYKERETEYLHFLAQKHDVLKAVMGLQLDGVLDLPHAGRPDIPTMEKYIRQAYETGDEGHVKTVVALARSYEGFPFLDVMRDLAKGEKNRNYYQARGYVDAWLRQTKPETYEQLVTKRKKEKEVEKAQRQFENAKRFCELESRRDGRDCSQYETPPE